MRDLWRPLAAVVATGLVAALGTVVTAANGGAQAAGSQQGPGTAPAKPARPSIVLVLMDDFSSELLATMPHAQQLALDGATYPDSFVVDSLCCPSRAALLTGRLPHQTGVRTNTSAGAGEAIGGYEAFAAHGNEPRQFSVSLQEAGWTTGFVGKYMNGYETRRSATGARRPPPKVPGWDEFQAILGGGYNGWNFKSTYLDEQGRVRLREHPKPPRESPVEVLDASYATTVAGDAAVDFIERHRDDEAPYFLEVATYGPHGQLNQAYPDNPVFPSAFADRAPAGDPTGGHCGTRPCGELTLADLAGYDDPREDNAPTYLHPDGSTSPAPAWRTNPINTGDAWALTQYRDRARMVQSIDRLLARVRAAVGPDTYVFLTADNGFHLGQHQLNGGKGTPYDSDTRVPMVVAGPDVPPGTRTQVVSNIDLAPTFEDLAGVTSPSYRSGTSFADSLRRPWATGSRFAFVEHTQAPPQPGEVDGDVALGSALDVVPSYVAVRGEHGLLARFDLDPSPGGVDHAWELYRYDVPWEDRNVFAEDHDRPWARELMARLQRFDGCEPEVCRTVVR